LTGARTSAEVRLVRPGEHEEAGAVVLAAYRALPGSNSSPGYDLVLADVGRRAEEAEVYVAVAGAPAGKGVLGCVTFVPDMTSPWAEMVEPGESAVRMLAVDPAAQGRGIGRALLEQCIARGRELGSSALFLHSTPWMVVAHGLYERSGFVRVPERDWRPVPEVPLLAYRLEL
jgi:ribosomal protein S18 acetylase RimI-like enzyme